MKVLTFKSYTLLFLLFALVSSQFRTDGDFCNSNDDCSNNCCKNKKCQFENNCLAMVSMDAYIDATYCELHVDCEQKCCLFGECNKYNECFIRYDRPLLIGAAVGVGIAFLVIGLAFFLTPFVQKFVPPPPPEESFHDDNLGPIYYEGEDPVVEEEFRDNMEGPLYYAAEDELKPEEEFKDDNQGPAYYETAQPVPEPQVQPKEESFRDDVGPGYYDETTLNNPDHPSLHKPATSTIRAQQNPSHHTEGADALDNSTLGNSYIQHNEFAPDARLIRDF